MGDKQRDEIYRQVSAATDLDGSMTAF